MGAVMRYLARPIFCLVASMSAFISHAPSAMAETAAQAIHEYDTGSADDRHIIEGVVVSEMDGAAWVQVYAVKIRHQPPIYCRGDAPVMTPAQMVEAVRAVIAKSPDYGNLSLGASVVIALTEKYRCG